jgi:hypothetical protein
MDESRIIELTKAITQGADRIVASNLVLAAATSNNGKNQMGEKLDEVVKEMVRAHKAALTHF